MVKDGRTIPSSIEQRMAAASQSKVNVLEGAAAQN
jgi:hypothetical protein